MNGVSSADFKLIIVESEQALLPEQNDEYRPVQGWDGQYHVPRELGLTERRVRFFRQNESSVDWREAREDIVRWLYSRNERNVYFSDESGTFRIGKVTNADVPERYNPDTSFWVTFTLQPFRYSALKDLSLGSTGGTVTNNGGMNSPYLLTIRPSSAVGSLSVTVNGVTLTHTGSIPANAVVTVNTDELEFRVGGELRVLELSGYFEELAPGNNTVTISAAGTHRIEFRERSL